MELSEGYLESSSARYGRSWQNDAAELEEVREYWNKVAAHSNLKLFIEWSPWRKTQLRDRLADAWWKAHWKQGIDKMAASEDLTGGLFNATFGWLVDKKDNLIDVFEGKYEDKKHRHFDHKTGEIVER